MDSRDYYTNKELRKVKSKLYGRIIGGQKDQKNKGSGNRDKNLQEIEDIRNRRRENTSRFANLVNLFLIIGLIVIVLMIFNIAEKLYN